MTLEEIKSKICDLRCDTEELQDEARDLWVSSSTDKLSEVAEYLETELEYIAYRLSELENVELEESEDEETDGEDESEEEIDDWYFDLSYTDRARLCGISTPGNGRDDLCEFLDFTEKWWNAKTLQQKREIFEQEDL